MAFKKQILANRQARGCGNLPPTVPLGRHDEGLREGPYLASRAKRRSNPAIRRAGYAVAYLPYGLLPCQYQDWEPQDANALPLRPLLVQADVGPRSDAGRSDRR